MARIELKNTTLRLIDGYSQTADVNDTPVTGDINLDVDGFGSTGNVDVGTKFTFAGIIRRYFITATNANAIQLVTADADSGNFTISFTGTVANPISVQTTAGIDEGATAATVQFKLEELAAIDVGDVVVTGAADGPWTVEFTGQYAKADMNEMTVTDVDLITLVILIVTTTFVGGTPHNITFTPALLTADGIPSDNDVITFAGRTLSIKVGDGNLTYNETKEYEYDLDRGLLDTVREGEEQPVEVSFDFIWDFITSISGAATPTIEDVLKKRGGASQWETSSSDPCEPYAVDIEIEQIQPCGNVQREIITIADFRYESLDHDPLEASVSATGRANVTEAVAVRTA